MKPATFPTRAPLPLALAALALALALAALLPLPLSAEDAPPCHDAVAATAPAVADGAKIEQLEIPDLPVTDQDGRKLHFYRDLVAGRKVAMNFVFTTCTTICPPMGAHFSKIRRLVAEGGRAEGARKVALISISIDPSTDTPARLKAWQENFGEASGWTLVTGTKQDITRLLRALRVYSADPAAHAPVVLLGDDAAGRWQRVYGLTPPAELLATLDLLSGTKVANKENGR